jgi:hypothetical protein
VLRLLENSLSTGMAAAEGRPNRALFDRCLLLVAEAFETDAAWLDAAPPPPSDEPEYCLTSLSRRTIFVFSASMASLKASMSSSRRPTSAFTYKT